MPREHHRVVTRPARRRRARRWPASAAWLVGGAVRDRLLGRETDRRRRRASPATRGGGRADRPARAGGAVVRALRRVRRLARGRARPRLAGRPGRRCATAASTPTSPRATSRSTRWPSRWRGGELRRPARRPRRPRGAAAADGLRRGARAPTRCARCGRCASRSSSASSRAGHAARRAPTRAGAASGSPPSASSPSSSASSAPTGPRRGLALMDELGLTAAVLPELAALRGVEQNVYHHRDVHGHTLEVLDAVVGARARPGGRRARRPAPRRRARCWPSRSPTS